jgi:hypothetical protein
MATQAPTYFRAVAIDYDGTLADGGQVKPDTLAALAEARQRALRRSQDGDVLLRRQEGTRRDEDAGGLTARAPLPA